MSSSSPTRTTSARTCSRPSEDKTFPGAIVAGLASPWGQAVSAGDPSNTYFGSYREVFARDLYEAWTGLIAAGDLATARDATLFLFKRQQLPDGSMPRNSLVNGKLAPDSFGAQLDETAYPILMAAQLGLTDRRATHDRHQAAANFVVRPRARFGVERWEEQAGYSPSTIAAEIAGLLAAADIADANHDAAVGAPVPRCRRRLPALDQGLDGHDQRPARGRAVLHPPVQDRRPERGDHLQRRQRRPDARPAHRHRRRLPRAARLGCCRPTDPDVASSLPVVDATIKSDTPSGPAGTATTATATATARSDGRPWAPPDRGPGTSGRCSSAERAEHADPDRRRRARPPCSTAMAQLRLRRRAHPRAGLGARRPGRIAVRHRPDLASIGFVNGKPAGSAAPLTWSAARSSGCPPTSRPGAGRPTAGQPSTATSRTPRARRRLTRHRARRPLGGHRHRRSPSTGTTVAGQPYRRAGDEHGRDSATTAASTTAAPDGSFTRPPRHRRDDRAEHRRHQPDRRRPRTPSARVVFDFVPGTLLLDVTDPASDDNGPGNYAYPTSDNFKPGAFDLKRFQVYDDGRDVIFRVQTRDLTPTFGSPLGAQLVDVYVHDPGAATTSTAASFPQRNYSIDRGSAWSRLIEVQGFGQRYIDARTRTVGTSTIRANQISRFITFTVPTASSAAARAGLGLHGRADRPGRVQPDQARGFQPTPQDFQFGVCATASTDPHCTFDPDMVPKAMDVITPSGVAQSTELDYTLGPVVIRGVTIP